MRKSIIFLAVLLLGGCVGAPPPPPPGANAGPNAATVVFLRDDCPPKALGGLFSLDGVPRAKLSVNEYVAARCAPGKRELKFGFSLLAGVPPRKMVIVVAPGSTRYFLYSSQVAIGSFYPGPVTSITSRITELTRADAEVLQAGFARQP